MTILNQNMTPPHLSFSKSTPNIGPRQKFSDDKILKGVISSQRISTEGLTMSYPYGYGGYPMSYPSVPVTTPAPAATTTPAATRAMPMPVTTQPYIPPVTYPTYPAYGQPIMLPIMNNKKEDKPASRNVAAFGDLPVGESVGGNTNTGGDLKGKVKPISVSSSSLEPRGY